MDILFAVLPFATIEHPAIGVSLLQAGLKRAGFSAVVEYFNIDLAERIGIELYDWLAQRRELSSLATVAPGEFLIGEWFFADLVFPGRIPVEGDYIRKFLPLDPETKTLIPEILHARQHRQEFIEHCVAEIQRRAPRVVGFTTTFHQTCACLAVAMRLKARATPPIVIFGGANCEGEMGLQMLRSFPWIDYVCTGEGDEALPSFLQGLLRESVPRPVPGILKQDEQQELSLPAPVRNLDSLPFPDYCDYFEKLRASSVAAGISPRLLIETARGCWWGEKQHCIFCGLNGETMAYRSKRPARVLEELAYLHETYGVSRIDCVDNILDTHYIQTVFPELIRKGPKLELFYETKSNLRFEQLRTLRAAGVCAIQPGIESFSNQILRLMKKGCTALQNIQLLRWCKELDIWVAWNILYGFPNEPPSEYQRMAELIPLLTHLQPPAFCEKARMDRFSPLFTDSKGYGLLCRHPAPAYRYVYPLDDAELERLAYFFEFDYADGRNPANYVDDLIREVRHWVELSKEPPRLDLFRAGSVLVISDTRPCAVKPNHVLSGLAAEIYLRCDTPQTIGGLVCKLGHIVGEAEVRAILEQLLAGLLMIEMEDHYLNLAVLRNRCSQDTPADHAKEERDINALNVTH